MDRVRHVIYFPPLIKSQTTKIPENKNNIQYIPLHQLEETGNNTNIGEFLVDFYLIYWKVFLDEDILQKRPDKADIAVIMYTSGSTGTPKGYFFKDHFTNLFQSKTFKK